MMEITLTNNPADRGQRMLSSGQCDCNCACPVEGAPLPVLSLPVAYYLELTPACDNRCPGCGNVYAGGRPALAPPLDGTRWRDLIARLAPHAYHLKLTGGEPVLHPDFALIVREIAERDIPFTVLTNGRWPDPGRTICLLREVKACRGLLVSLHGPDARAHEAFTHVPGSFAQTVDNVRRAVDAGLNVATSVVLHRGNWDRIPRTLDLALDLGADHVVCNRPLGAPVDRLTPDEAQLRAAIAAVELLRRTGRPIRFGNCIPQCYALSSATGCLAGRAFATIDPWGRMRPCNHAPLIAGDLTRQSVEEVWHGAEMGKWRSLIPAGCTACAAFAACHGGCRAQALLVGQERDPLMRSPLTARPRLPGDEMALYAGLRPVGRYTYRHERGVSVLIHESQVVPVPAGCESMPSMLDGTLSLRQIERRYGDGAIRWVGTLYREGMVDWQITETCVFDTSYEHGRNGSITAAKHD